VASPSDWSLDPDGFVTAAGLVVLYAAGIRAFPAPRWRIVCFAAGVAVVFFTRVSPLATISNHYLLSAHLIQNVAVAEWAPALLVLGIPPALGAFLARAPGARTLTFPPVALLLWLGTYVVWHLPWAYDAALEHPRSLLHLEHLSYLAAGIVLWWPVLQDAPRRLHSGGKALYLVAAFFVASPLGLLLSLLGRPIYTFYEHAPRLWGVGVLQDQRIAGVTMTVEEAILFFCVVSYYVVCFFQEEEAGDLRNLREVSPPRHLHPEPGHPSVPLAPSTERE
jgi:cytochrome c oxidase assembly factor CtaG